MTTFRFFPILLLLALLLYSCQSTPEPIEYGTDQCDFCRMTISNPKFGAELVTDKGRVLKYDAAECMAQQLGDPETAPAYENLYAVAFDDPRHLYPVDSLYFIISPDFRSPMGANLAAFSEPTALEEKYQQQLLTWDEVVQNLNE